MFFAVTFAVEKCWNEKDHFSVFVSRIFNFTVVSLQYSNIPSHFTPVWRESGLYEGVYALVAPCFVWESVRLGS